jgi:hypothetical protein
MIVSDGEASQIFLPNWQPELTSSPASRLPAHSSLMGPLSAAAWNPCFDLLDGLGLPAI